MINVDDNAPQFGNVSLVKISEGVGMDTTVVTLKATDADGSSLNYTIDSGNIGNVFKIDSAKGKQEGCSMGNSLPYTIKSGDIDNVFNVDSTKGKQARSSLGNSLTYTIDIVETLATYLRLNNRNEGRTIEMKAEVPTIHSY